MDCTEFSLSVTTEICDWRHRGESLRRATLGILSPVLSVALGYLQLWCKYGFKLQAQCVLAGSQCRRRPLLVTAEALQRLLGPLSGLEPVHHLTGQNISAFITPTEDLHTSEHGIQHQKKKKEEMQRGKTSSRKSNSRPFKMWSLQIKRIKMCMTVTGLMLDATF